MEAGIVVFLSNSSPASSSSAGSKTPASKPGPVSVAESPGKPKSGAQVGGTSPSKPKSQVPAPPQSPKLPKLPELPKPNSGWQPPKGSVPGYTQGIPPVHDSKNLLPIGEGNHEDHGKASSSRSCIDPAGLERLRCQKVDAIMGTLFAIIFFIASPFLIYWFIRSCRKRRTRRRNRQKEEGIELTSRAIDCDPTPHIDNSIQITNSNIGLAISTSEETVPLATEQAQNISSSSPVGNPSEVRQPRARNLSPVRRPSHAYIPRSSLNRGRPRFRAVSLGSVASDLSSGMIRTAMLGEAWQEATIINVQPSLVSMRDDSERMSSSGDADVSNNGDNGRRDSTEEESRESVVSDVDREEIKKEDESQAKSSGRESSSESR